MSLTLLFIGTAAATGLLGTGKTVKAGIDAAEAGKLNDDANAMIQAGTEELNAQRFACGRSLGHLGEEKVAVLSGSVTRFLESFKKIKNVDFRGSEGLDELSKLAIDSHDFEELEGLAHFASSLAGGVVGGAASGAAVAFGAFGAAQALATASTGTAIATLSGAAATNATLAFFGGGSLAAGGLGMAGGAAVLGGLVAGPALLVLGFVTGGAAAKELEKAKANHAEALVLYEQLKTGSSQCEAIRRRTYMFHNLLARLDARFVPLVYGLEDVIEREGDDYRLYSSDAKGVVASCASIAVTIKSILDTPLLTDDGLLTDASATALEAAKGAVG